VFAYPKMLAAPSDTVKVATVGSFTITAGGDEWLASALPLTSANASAVEGRQATAAKTVTALKTRVEMDMHAFEVERKLNGS
jgi:hypothetical protein